LDSKWESPDCKSEAVPLVYASWLRYGKRGDNIKNES